MNVVFDVDEYYCQECDKMMNCSHIDLMGWAEELQTLKTQIMLNGYFIIHHKLPNSTPAKAFQCSKIFFSQNQETKEQTYSLDRARRGYSSVQTDNFASLSGFKKPNDIVEKFRIGPIETDFIDEYYTSKEGRVHFFPNTWPNHIEGFQVALEAYYEAMRKLSCYLLALVERLFDLPVDSLVREMHRHTSILGLNAYLPLSTYPPTVYKEHIKGVNKDEMRDDNGLGGTNNIAIERVAEHVDVSVFTIVAESSMERGDDNTGVEGSSGEGEAVNTTSPSSHQIKLQMFNCQLEAWEDVHLGPDCFLINVGECLSDWSRSTSRIQCSPSSPTP
ncbi:isopenicillin N synthase family oxygenase, partial [archaeon]